MMNVRKSVPDRIVTVGHGRNDSPKSVNQSDRPRIDRYRLPQQAALAARVSAKNSATLRALKALKETDSVMMRVPLSPVYSKATQVHQAPVVDRLAQASLAPLWVLAVH
jgi:hypothetical protein